jgi:hypothetical protein
MPRSSCFSTGWSGPRLNIRGQGPDAAPVAPLSLVLHGHARPAEASDPALVGILSASPIPGTLRGAERAVARYSCMMSPRVAGPIAELEHDPERSPLEHQGIRRLSTARLQLPPSSPFAATNSATRGSFVPSLATRTLGLIRFGGQSRYGVDAGRAQWVSYAAGAW